MNRNFKLGLSSCDKKINEDLFRSYSKAGIESMEISLSYEDCEVFDFSKVQRWSCEYHVALHSFHIPFAPFDMIDISRPSLATQSIELAKKYILKGSRAGIKIFVIHASGEPIGDEERAVRMTCAKRSLFALAEYAKTHGCVIAVEDLPRTCLGNCSKELLELISVHPDLRICFDTNHLLSESLAAFIKAAGDKIVTTHISDFDFINERHWMPGEGKIDWTEVIRGLREAGYFGCLLYELGYSAPWSIDRPCMLSCADFKTNFDEITSGKKPTRIGTPKQNLGMWEIEE